MRGLDGRKTTRMNTSLASIAISKLNNSTQSFAKEPIDPSAIDDDNIKIAMNTKLSRIVAWYDKKRFFGLSF